MEAKEDEKAVFFFYYSPLYFFYLLFVKKKKKKQTFLDTLHSQLQAQQICFEFLTNICSSDAVDGIRLC